MQASSFQAPYEILREMLIECRLAGNLSQEQLGELLSMGQSAISKVERGIQRIDLVELHQWLGAVGGPSLAEFATAFEERVSSIKAAERQWLASQKSQSKASVKRVRQPK